MSVINVQSSLSWRPGANSAHATLVQEHPIVVFKCDAVLLLVSPIPIRLRMRNLPLFDRRAILFGMRSLPFTSALLLSSWMIFMPSTRALFDPFTMLDVIPKRVGPFVLGALIGHLALSLL